MKNKIINFFSSLFLANFVAGIIFWICFLIKTMFYVIIEKWNFSINEYSIAFILLTLVITYIFYKDEERI